MIRSFNDDKPFDRFVLEQLAGDVIGRGDPEVEVGTAFLVCGPYDNVGNQDAKQAANIRANTIDEIIRATGEAFLGLTVGCARCHDHKFDPMLQGDYYALYATFAGTRHGERVVDTAGAKAASGTPRSNRSQDARIDSATNASELEAVTARAEAQAAEIESGWTRAAGRSARHRRNASRRSKPGSCG